LYNKLAQEQAEFNRLQLDDPTLFTKIPINPTILAKEQAFQVKRNPLSQIAVQETSEELKDID
jgi:hypothetical protein